MRIVIAGGTGFLGTPLAESFAEDGHDVRVLTRSVPPGQSQHEPGTGVPGMTRVGWFPDGHAGPWREVIDGADVVINLAGESIAAKRWSPQRKAQLRDSRILPTRSLAAAINGSQSRPPVFISGSAVGYYGPSGDEPKTEDAPPGHDFLAHICEDWENETHRVDKSSTRTVRLRSGIVLDRSGGALAQIEMPFRLFVGGPIGSGRQYMSWIHRADWLEMVRWIAQTPSISGPINATAPHPVTNAHFAKALGRAMHRPAILPTPGIGLRVLFGELASSLVTGQRAIPRRAQAAGFQFRYPEIEIAFGEIFEKA